MAGHIAPADMDRTVAAYREHFRPLRGRPSVVLCLPVLVARSDDEARWWHRCVQQRYLDRLRTGGAPLRGPDDVELDWSAGERACERTSVTAPSRSVRPSTARECGERYRVDGMLEAALVGSADTVRAQLRDVARRLAPDEVMAMTDLPDPGVTLRSHIGLAGIVAAVAPAGATS